MALDDIVSVTITAQTAVPTKPGFGTPLIAAYTSVFPELVRAYSQTADMVADGFGASDPAVLAAGAAFAQNPRPKQVKVGKRTTAYTKTFELTVLDATEGRKYSFSLNGTAITYTVLSSETPTTVATAIAGAITTAAIANVTASAAVAVVTISATAGKQLRFKGASVLWTIAETTTDANIDDDLTAIALYDNDWYGLVLDSNSKAEVLTAASWVETNKKLFIATCFDSENVNPSSTSSALYHLKNSGYARTAGLLQIADSASNAGAAWLGAVLPTDPGSETWMFKTLAGIAADTLTTTQANAALGKNGNIYTTIAGINMTQGGITGAGEFIDVTRFVDWLTAEIQINILGLLANARKVPYTDLGVDTIKAVIMGALVAGINAGGLAAKPAPQIQAPKVADVSPVDKGNRNLPDVFFQAELAGAIHKLSITGALLI